VKILCSYKAIRAPDDNYQPLSTTYLGDVPNTEGVILGNKIEFDGLFPSKTLDLINGSGAFGPSSYNASGRFGSTPSEPTNLYNLLLRLSECKSLGLSEIV